MKIGRIRNCFEGFNVDMYIHAGREREEKNNIPKIMVRLTEKLKEKLKNCIFWVRLNNSMSNLTEGER